MRTQNYTVHRHTVLQHPTPFTDSNNPQTLEWTSNTITSNTSHLSCNPPPPPPHTKFCTGIDCTNGSPFRVSKQDVKFCSVRCICSLWCHHKTPHVVPVAYKNDKMLKVCILCEIISFLNEKRGMKIIKLKHKHTKGTRQASIILVTATVPTCVKTKVWAKTGHILWETPIPTMLPSSTDRSGNLFW
jgi:hypothetical protein